MAGRGTDIVLGGCLDAELEKFTENADEDTIQKIKNDWQERHNIVIKAGGLRIIGSERHESRRIDNQLRGRAGRQGDPGSSRFYLSLEDNLMRIFASERVAGIMRKLGMEAGEPIEHTLVTKAIENAQRKLEGHNFDIRKQLLGYDNVANDQRKVIYSQRSELMQMQDPKEVVERMREDVISRLVAVYIPLHSLEDQWDIPNLTKLLNEDFRVSADIKNWIDADHSISPEEIKNKILNIFETIYASKEERLGREILSQFEKSIILQCMDNHWREHLSAMEYLRQGIHLRGYAQKDPRQEYKRESFELFTNMLHELKYDIIKFHSSVEMASQEDINLVEEQRKAESDLNLTLNHNIDSSFGDTNSEDQIVQFKRTTKKIGRNDLCNCGSGKKYKNCHGVI